MQGKAFSQFLKEAIEKQEKGRVQNVRKTSLDFPVWQSYQIASLSYQNLKPQTENVTLKA